jgi:hypothetical protein
MMTMMMGESIVCIQGNGDDGMMLLLQNSEKFPSPRYRSLVVSGRSMADHRMF